MIAQENTELASAFIQKTAVERAIPEMDKRLATVSSPFCIDEMSLVMRKLSFAYTKTGTDQMHGNRAAEQRLCFRYIASTFIPSTS